MTAYEVWRQHLGLTGNKWKEFKEDVRKNGYVCGSCTERFDSRYPVLICNECVEAHLGRYYDNPSKTYRHYVYALFNEEGSCVYVGVTKNPQSRLQQHVVDKDFEHMGLLKGFTQRDKAEECETMFIALAEPKYNKAVRTPKRAMPWQWAKAYEILSEPRLLQKASDGPE